MIKAGIIAVAAASAVAFAAAPANAGADHSHSFAFKSHEIETEGGMAGVYARMERKAASLCRTGVARASVTLDSRPCENALVDGWVEAVGSTRLNRLHATKRADTNLAAN